ncbi:hypothetical protein KSS87_010066 [Heliosperma pusillum]|nr:hypothetical protein KSS87_010066 [Heliosperma pusillum]
MEGDWWFVVVVKGGKTRLGRNYYLHMEKLGNFTP